MQRRFFYQTSRRRVGRRRFFPSAKGGVFLSLILATAACIGVFAVKASVGRVPAAVAYPPPTNPAPPVTAALGGQAQADVTVEFVTVQPWGFDPEELTVSKGRFMLAIDNRSRTDDLAVGLFQETGNKLHEVRMPRGRMNWNAIVDLRPGTYVLKEQNHPKWVCTITVKPH